MEESSASRTSPTLLRRLRDPADQRAWATFVDRYGGKIYAWCRHWSLQEADAEDVTQNILLAVPQKLRGLREEYDPNKGSFRGWLKKVVSWGVHDFFRRRRHAALGSGDDGVWQVLESVEAQKDLWTRLREAFDLELFELALERAQAHFQPQTWEAFRLTELEHRSGEEAAQLLGLQVSAVLVYRGRVRKRVREEVQLLEAQKPGGDDDDLP